MTHSTTYPHSLPEVIHKDYTTMYTNTNAMYFVSTCKKSSSTNFALGTTGIHSFPSNNLWERIRNSFWMILTPVSHLIVLDVAWRLLLTRLGRQRKLMGFKHIKESEISPGLSQLLFLPKNKRNLQNISKYIASNSLKTKQYLKLLHLI